ncbi:MAG: GNAT family N-acetyltransferase [Pikeienuella sp.]
MPPPLAESAWVGPLSKDRADAYRDAIDAVARERRWLAMVEAPEREALLRRVQQQIAAGLPIVIAVAEGAVLGWCDILPLGRGARAHVGGLGMGIRVGHRGAGLGGRLLTGALARAAEIGLARVELKVRATNAPAIRLYRRAGFVEEGRLRDAWRLDGVTDDLIAMGLRFTSGASAPGLHPAAGPAI